MSSIYEDLSTIYGEDLDAVEKRHLMTREATRLSDASTKLRAEISDRVQDEISYRVKLSIANEAAQSALVETILESDSRERMNNLDNFVRASNNIRDSHAGLVENLTADSVESVQRALDAYTRNYPSIKVSDPYRAVWEAGLGTSRTLSPAFETDPAAPMILARLRLQAGDDFDPSKFGDEVTLRNYEKLEVAADRQRKEIDRYKKGLDDDHAILDEAIGEKARGATPEEVSDRLTAYAEAAETTARSAWKLTSDDITISKKVKEELGGDVEYQKMVDREDRLWKTVLGDDGSALEMREALGNLLAQPAFQEWADSNGFVVGTSKVDNGRVVEFSPGKDLLVAAKIAQKQRAARPRPGDKGPLIARKGARDLVRVTTTDGEIILGKELPLQAADESGSMRISTTGGERYISPKELKRSEVLKTKRRFSLPDEIRKSRGDLDKMRAESAQRAIIGTPETPEIASTELADAPGPDAEALAARERLGAKARLAAMGAPAPSEAESMAAIGESAKKTGPQVQGKIPSADEGKKEFEDILESSPPVTSFEEVAAAEKRKRRTGALQAPPSAQSADVPTGGVLASASGRRKRKRKTA